MFGATLVQAKYIIMQCFHKAKVDKIITCWNRVSGTHPDCGKGGMLHCWRQYMQCVLIYWVYLYTDCSVWVAPTCEWNISQPLLFNYIRNKLPDLMTQTCSDPEVISLRLGVFSDQSSDSRILERKMSQGMFYHSLINTIRPTIKHCMLIHCKFILIWVQSNLNLLFFKDKC